MAKYLEKYGKITLDNGYAICFIRPGEKRPFGKEWEETLHGPKRIAAAIRKGRGGFGVGIKTKGTPGVDIDCYDRDIVDHMREFTIELLGETIERVGQPPKTLLVYRAEKPFRKVQSTRYEDDEGRSVKLEVLGDGQQFVAFHVHPDTGEPYRWKDKRAPHNVSADELPTITEKQAQKIADEFDRIARERGWRRASKISRVETKNAQGKELDFDDPFITDKHKVQISPDELRAKLQMIPDNEDHDIWFHVGMALYHQFDGSDEGLMLWHEWSSQASNYDSDVLDDRWKSFDIEGKRREPITARFILKHAKLEEERIAGEELDDVKASIENAPDLPAVRDVMARIKTIAFDQIVREGLIVDLKKRVKDVAGVSMSVPTIRKMVRYENPDNRSTPPWLQNYVYVQEDETFFNLETTRSLTKIAFDSTYARFMMTKRDRLEGNSSPEHSASQAALNRYQIPIVANKMYLPGEEAIFTLNGEDYANTYTDKGIPDMPEKLSKRDKIAIKRVIGHLEHLFIHERERKLLLDFFSFIVQNPGKRVNWAPIVQGIEGDGKTFFYEMMGSVIGAENVNTVPGEALTEKNTAWAEGSQFLFIEEIRLHGANRFDVINKVKPYITNLMVSVRRMRTDWYKVINTVNYYLATNHKDGMPVDHKDTRYFPMFSRWQTIAAIKQFNADNPKYYDNLYGALEHHSGAIRKWLLERELGEEFNPKKRAPVSAAKAEMIFLNQSEEEEAFEESIEKSTDPMYCKTLLCSDLVEDKMNELGGTAPYGRLLKQLLSEHGFMFIGRMRLDGETRRVWTQKPDLFRGEDGQIDNERVRKWTLGKLQDPDEVDISDL